MPSSKHTQERQVRYRLERAPLRAVDRVRRQRLAGECGLAGILDRVGDVEVAEPVADPAVFRVRKC